MLIDVLTVAGFVLAVFLFGTKVGKISKIIERCEEILDRLDHEQKK